MAKPWALAERKYRYTGDPKNLGYEVLIYSRVELPHPHTGGVVFTPSDRRRQEIDQLFENNPHKLPHIFRWDTYFSPPMGLEIHYGRFETFRPSLVTRIDIPRMSTPPVNSAREGRFHAKDALAHFVAEYRAQHALDATVGRGIRLMVNSYRGGAGMEQASLILGWLLNHIEETAPTEDDQINASILATRCGLDLMTFEGCAYDEQPDHKEFHPYIIHISNILAGKGDVVPEFFQLGEASRREH